MSEAVDTRVVEAKFDSAQFEKGVDRTVKKLDELKKSLDLEESGKSIAQLASKTQEATEKASGALEKLENRITTFTGMLKNKLLSGIADEVVGAVFKMKNAFEGLVKTLSTGQIASGMQRYTDIMGSVRTLVFSGVKQETAYSTIERLGMYADQTSYSLDQLVSTMSKFKTAGASLDTAERMVIGLSNAAASMGVNAQEASRAYLNLQQAYSKGAMLQNDWISFESLPMVGEKFNQAILDAAVHIGTLKKEANGTYSTINKIDKQVKTSGADAKGITAENLGTKLSSRWFNKAVMQEVFGSTYYFNLTDTEEESASEMASGIKKFEKGMKSVTRDVEKEQESLNAALEKKEITKDQYAEQLSQLATEDVYSQFSDDFKKNAPDPKQMQSELQKSINDYMKENKLDKIDYDTLYTKQLETYLDTIEQKMLDEKTKELDEALKNEEITLEEYNKQLEEFKKNNNLTRFGWEAYRAGQEARSLNDVLNTLKDTISRGWATSFELIFGKLDEAAKFFTWLTESNLANAIYSIGTFRNNVLEAWAGNENEGGRKDLLDALEKLDEILGRLLGKFHIFTADEEDSELAAYNLGARLSEATRNFKDFVFELDQWLNDERVQRFHDFIEAIGNVLQTVFKFAGLAASTALRAFVAFSPVLEALTDNITKIINKVNEALANEGYGAIKDGIDNVFIAIEPLVKEDGPLVRFINFLGEIASFFAEMAAGTFVSNVQFFSDTLGFLIELFGGTSAQKKNYLAQQIQEVNNALQDEGLDKETRSGYEKKLKELLALQEQVEKLDKQLKDGTITPEQYKEAIDKLNIGGGVLDGIKNSIMELGNTCKEALQFVADFFHNLYEDILVLLGIHEVQEGEEGGLFSNLKKYLDSSEFVASVKQWIKDIPKNLKKLWATIDEWLFGKKVKVKDIGADGKTSFVTVRLKSGVSKMLDDLFKTIKEFITVDVPKKAKEIWNSIIEAIFGKSTQSTTAPNTQVRGSDDMVKSGFQTWFEKAVQKVKDWIASIPETIKDLWNTIIDFIFYRDPLPDEVNPDTGDTYGPTDRVKNGFAKWFESIPEKVLGWIKDLPAKVSEMWNNFIDAIFYKTEKVEIKDAETGEIVATVDQKVETGLKKWWDSIPSMVKDIPTRVQKLWNDFIDFIFYKNETVVIRDPRTGEVIRTVDQKVETGFKKWWDSIPGKVKDIPTKVQKIWNDFIDAIFYKNETVVIRDPRNGDIIRTVDQKVETGFKQWLDNTVVKVKELITGWDDIISGLWTMILDAIFGKTEQSTTAPESDHRESKNTILTSVEEFVQGLGIDIGGIIAKIPEYIVNGWNSSVDLFKNVFDHITNWLRNINLADEMKKQEDEVVASASQGFNGTEEESGFLQSVVKLGKNLGSVITTTIPAFLTEAFTAISNHSDDLLAAIKEIFNLDDKGDWVEDLKDKAENIGTKVSNVIRSIPDLIRTATESVKRLLGYEQEKFDPLKYADILKNFGKVEADEYKKEIESQFNLWDIIKEVFIAGGDAAKNLGPDILNALNEAFTWIGQKLTGATEELDAAHDEGKRITDVIAEKMESGSEDDQALFGAISSIGQTIKNLIVNVIPDFIRSGIDELVMQIPNIVSEIGAALGGSETKEEVNEAVEKSGKTLLEGMQGFLSEDQIYRVLGNSGDTPSMWGAMAEGGELVKRVELIKVLKERQDEMKKELGDLSDSNEDYQNLSQFITNLEASNDVMYDLTNTMMQGNTIVDTLEHYVKRTDRMAELEKEIWAAEDERITSLGNGKVGYDEIVERKKALQKELDELNKLTDEYVKVDVNKSKKAKGNAEQFSSNVMGAISQILNMDLSSDTTKLIAIGALLSILVYNIRIIIDNAQFIDDIGYTFKWAGIAILIGGIVGILGYITYLATQTDQTKFNSVSKIFTSLGEFIEKLGTLLTIISGLKTAGSIFDLFTSINNKKAAANGGAAAAAGITGFWGWAGNIFGNLLQFGGKTAILTLDAKAIGGGITELFDGLTSVAQQIGIAIDSLMVSLEPGIRRMAELNSVMDEALEAFGKFLTLLEQFRALISEEKTFASKPESIRDFAKDAEGHIVGIKTTATFLSSTTEDELFALGQGADTSQSSLEERIEWIYRLTEFLFEMTHALKELENLEDPKAAIQKAIDIITNPDYGFVDLFNALFGIFNPKISNLKDAFKWANPEDLENAGISLRLLSDALSIFTSSVSGLSPESISVLDHSILVIQELVKLVSGTDDTIRIKEGNWDFFLGKGDNTIGTFGRVMASFGGNMQMFFEKVKAINVDESKAELLQKNTDLVLKTVRSMAKSSTLLTNDENVKNLQTMLGGLEGMGTKIMTFLNEIASFETVEGFDIDFIETMINSIGSIVDILNKNRFGYLTDHEEDGINYDLQRIELIKTALLGVNGDGSDGFVGLLFEIHRSLSSMSQAISEETEFDFDETVEALKSFTMLVANINELLLNTNIPEDMNENPFTSVIESLGSFNFGFETINAFIENVKTLDQNGIDKAIGLFSSLRDLAETLHYFGEESYENAYDRIITFDWAAFMQSIKDSFQDANGKDMYDIGVEIGEYLDSGLASGIRTGTAITAAKELAEAVSGTFTVSWQIGSPSKVAKKLAMYFDEGLNDGLLKYGALPVGAAEDTADSILDVMFRALENNDTPEDVKGYTQTIIDALTDFDKKDIDKGYWMYLENMERYNRAVEKEAEKAKENSSSFWDVMTYLFEAPKDPTKPGLLEGFLGDVFGAGLTSNVELTEEDQETVKNAIKLLKGEVNEVASEAVKEEVGNNIFTSMSIWDLMMFRTRKSLEYDENSGFAKAGKFAMAFADRISKIKQNLIPNLSGVVDDEGIWNTIIHMYTDKSGEMQKLTSALLSDMTQIGDKYPELSGVAAALGEVFKQLDKSGGGWDVLGQVLDAAAKEFTDNDAIQYVNKIFGQLRSAAEGKEGSELGYSITDVLLSSVNEFLTGKFGDSPVVNAVTTYANSIPEQIKEAIASGKQGAELVEYLLGLVRNGAEDYLSEENPLAAMVVEKISELIGLSKDEDLTIEPKVKPVLEMSDDFKSGMDTINSFLGGFFNPAAWFGGENPTLNTNTSLDLASQIPQPKVIDYSSDITTIKNNMSYLQSTMAGFNRSLSSMRFVIKGSELAYTIGPDINEYLGYEDMTRGSRYDVVPQYQT